MTDYPIVSLGELASPESGSIAIGPFGSRMKSDTYTSQGVPVVRGANISSGRSLIGTWVFVSEEFAQGIPNCIARTGDLVLPHRGSIGEVAIIGPELPKVVLSSSMMKFRPDAQRADSTYVYYCLKSDAGRNEIMRFASQVGTPGIGQPLTSLRQMRIPLPPLSVQQIVGRTLSTLDDKIELNRRMNATLEAIAQAIFRDWFVDFGPTRRKLAGVTDPVEIMGGLVQDGGRAAELAALFPDVIGESGLPERWEKRPLLEVAHLISGGTPKTDRSDYWGGEISWASAKDVSQCGALFLLDTERSITRKGLDNSSTKIVPKMATVVVARGATTGRYCMFGNDLAMNQTCYGLESNTSHPVWLHLAFGRLVSRLQGAAHGSVFDTITSKTLQSVEVVWPQDEVLGALENIVRPIYDKALSNAISNQTLAATRDLLLPKLMSGEIRLGDAEATAEAAQ
ncbi:MAG: restriction endonuclease subunit S [Pseudomonadota bacterium]